MKKKAIDKYVVGLTVLLIILILRYVWILLLPNDWTDCLDTEAVKKCDFSVEVDNGTERYVTQLPAALTIPGSTDIIVHKELTRDDLYGDSMMFYSTQADVAVYLNGEELLRYDNTQRDSIFNQMPGNRWCVFQIPEDFESGELVIEFSCKIGYFMMEVPELYMGTKSAFLFYILHQGSLSLAVAVIVSVLGMALLVLAAVIRSSVLPKRMFYLGIMGLAIGQIMLTNSRLIQLFTSTIPYMFYFWFVSFFLLPAALLAYILTYPTIAKHKVFHGLYWISVLNFIVAVFLQIMGSDFFLAPMMITYLIETVAVIAMLFSTISALKRKIIYEDREVYIAFGLMALFFVLDIISLPFISMNIVSKTMPLKVLVLAIHLGLSVSRQLKSMQVREAEHKLYKKLAFVDIMTDMENRSAFQKDIEDMERQENIGKVSMVVADLNNLKTINDKFGHASGDDAIIRAAFLLQECFGEIGKCYRIGGDEFCVVAVNAEEAVLQACCNKLEQRAKEDCELLSYPFSIACGYGTVEAGALEECYKLADSAMYRKKEQMKASTN